MDLNTRLAEIREMQGLDPLPNPSVIQGFESGSSPPPTWNPPTSTQDGEEDGEPEWNPPTSAQDGEEDGEPDYPDSPLIDMAVKKVAPAALIPSAARIDIDLIVVDTEATYKGHTVSLNPTEKAAIARVILTASQRILDGHLRETEAVVPGVFSGGVLVASLGVPGPILKRGRGRPRKNA